MNFSDYLDLANHLLSEVSRSDSSHVMWLNRNVGKQKVNDEDLSKSLSLFFSCDSIKKWIIDRTVEKFFNEPHPFIARMQRPDRYILIGYAVEHHHFLKQWVRSCSLIIANTDHEDIQHYEIDNIISEWQGNGSTPSHHELLIKMGESYGVTREEIYNSVPLKETSKATEFWDWVCRNNTSVEGMSAMHSLELIANRNMKKYGARFGYFDSEILHDGSVTKETVNFLSEGYNADVFHSEYALDLIDKYAGEMKQSCQAIAIKSMDHFYEYLNARIERGEKYRNK